MKIAICSEIQNIVENYLQFSLNYEYNSVSDIRINVKNCTN